MARKKPSSQIVRAARRTDPPVSRQPGQISQDLPLFFYRFLPQWTMPNQVTAEVWRWTVYNQPIAMVCRETLIANILALDWKIQARDSNQRDEMKSEIEYYTKFFEEDNGIEYSTHIEWILGDALDLPFGGAIEVGREGDAPEGRVVWIEPLDAGTLFPTLNKEWPVGQRIEGYVSDPVYFPAHAINRIYFSPRREMKREGWGMAPPEKIYLALQMLNRGDVYYANLLLDTPEAGILDLMDMSKESAEQWVESFRSLMQGIDPFKIPVLYEHENEVRFIPFGKVPTDLMYDRITLKFAAIVTAGYGMSLGDIGLGQSTSGGDTLAGTIRQERKTRKTGFAVAKRKVIAYFNRLLPKELAFGFIDYDEELNVALGRARLANATAANQLIANRVFTPSEMRLQLIADGMISISVPEKVDEGEFDILPQMGFQQNERPGMLGNPQPPSSGGQGEATAGVGKSTAESSLHGVLKKAMEEMEAKATKPRLRKLINAVAPAVFAEVSGALQALSEGELENWRMVIEKQDEPTGEEELEKPLDKEDWWLLPLEEEEIITILSLAYLEAIKSAANEALYDLYEHNYLLSPYLDPNMIFKLENEFVLRSIRNRAFEMVRDINEGTKYYLRRILVKSIREGLTEAEIVNRIKQGLDLQEILRDNTFMQRLSEGIKRDLANLPQHRIERIVSYELATATNAGRIAQYRRMGLESKHWVHIGADVPCEICQSNIDVGVVPLDYQYQTVFGATESGAAHPYEHCEVQYVGAELYSLAKRGTLHIWTGD